jgi:predicted dehydrogenase
VFSSSDFLAIAGRADKEIPLGQFLRVKQNLDQIGIVGTGFVADLYMRSLNTFPQVRVVKAYDIDPARLSEFCAHWKVPAAQSLEELTGNGSNSPSLILNLTNPAAHFQVSRACLQAGKHVYSEKPIALDMSSARELCALASERSLLLASAPCSVLGEAAQTLWRAIRQDVAGKTRLVYAELDDDFISKAPFHKWRSESGAPWPYRDEFSVGCTLEHAGYYLTWLMAMYGSVEKVISASATLIEDKAADVPQAAPDYSCATLFFKSGVVARLTCSIVAPHDHSLRIIGDTGVLEIDRSWDNQAAVRLRRRFTIRRKLLNSPIARRIKIKGPSHPKVGRSGAAAMNFALGPAEMLSALREKRKCRLSADFALHLNEVTLAIQNGKGIEYMQTACSPMDPMPWAQN